jgi:hypothetical protein
MVWEGSYEWYQSTSLAFIYISTDLKKSKDPSPSNFKKLLEFLTKSVLLFPNPKQRSFLLS